MFKYKTCHRQCQPVWNQHFHIFESLLITELPVLSSIIIFFGVLQGEHCTLRWVYSALLDWCFFQNVDTTLCELNNNVNEHCNQQPVGPCHNIIIIWRISVKFDLIFNLKDILDDVLIELPEDQTSAALGWPKLTELCLGPLV